MKRVLFFLTGVILPMLLCGAPARRNPKTYLQADGTTLTLHLEGDENFSLTFTEDHIPVEQAEDGSFRYVTAISAGRRILSIVKAHDAGQRTIAERSVISTIDWESINAASQSSGFVRYDRTRDPDQNRIARPGEYSISRFPTKGTAKGLLLLVEFPDKRFTLDSLECNRHFSDMLNKPGYTDKYVDKGNEKDGAIGSVADYFKAQSYGVFVPEFEVVGPIMADNGYAYYGKNDSGGSDASNVRRLVGEICQKVYDRKLTDFSTFDADRNGTVDFVFVIYAGNAENYKGSDPNTIWPHQSSVSKQFGNMKISNYACSSELFYDSESTIDGIGTICHEFSHIIGLPDFYKTDGGSIFTMDSWSVMDYGSYDNNGYAPCGMTAFERFSLGWMGLTEISAPGSYRLPDLDTEGFAYRLSSNDPSQFIVLENHQKSGWFKYQKSSGLMATAVFYSKTAWADNTVNNIQSQKRYYILPADNNGSIETLKGDLFPYEGNDSLCLTSSPASEINKGESIDHPIKRIRIGNDSTVSFIIPGGNVTDGVESVGTASPRITRADGTVTVRNAEPFTEIQLFLLNGSLAATHMTDASGTCSFTCPEEGILLIRIQGRTTKLY